MNNHDQYEYRPDDEHETDAAQLHEHEHRDRRRDALSHHIDTTLNDVFDGCRRLDAIIVASDMKGGLPRLQFASLSAGTPAVNETKSVPGSRPAKACGPRAPTGYLVPRDLAERWSVCVDKVLLFIRTGELRAFNVASPTSSRPRYRISIDEVRRFEEQTRSAGPSPAAKINAPRRRKSSAAAPSSRTYF